MSAETTVKVLPAGGTWETIGADQAKGIMPENLSLTADTWGPQSASFLLKRDPDAMWSDLAAGNQVQVDVGGIPVWGGRITQTPTLDGPEPQIAVSCRGWQDHLADDQVDRYWVLSNVSLFRDMRSFPGCLLGDARATQRGQVAVDRGVIQIGFPKNTTEAYATGSYVGVTLDFGPGRTAPLRGVFNIETSYNVTWPVIIRTHSGEDFSSGSSGDYVNQALNSFASNPGWSGGTLATAYRYLSIAIYVPAGSTIAADVWARISKMVGARDTAYESGNASILKADDVVRDTLTSGALPLLSTSQARISDTTFSIPEFWPDSYRTPRELLDAVNAYHDYLVGVDADKQLYFRPRPTTPLFEVGKWSGSPFSDSSANSLDDLYNKVIVEYTAGDGTPGREVRTSRSGRPSPPQPRSRSATSGSFAARRRHRFVARSPWGSGRCATHGRAETFTRQSFCAPPVSGCGSTRSIPRMETGAETGRSSA
jgi:hypothetical protein